MKKDVAAEMVHVFAKWKESGQSLQKFGASEGIGYAKLQYWKRRFETVSNC